MEFEEIGGYEPSCRGELPRQSMPLIGREKDKAKALEKLRRQDLPLLTLTGPPGVGKTRLAMEMVEEVAGEFEDGFCYVPLEEVKTHDVVIPKIARKLGLEDSGEQPMLERLKAYLANKRLLLFLDTFEHVSIACTQVSALLASCRYLKVLVTSRVKLNIEYENLFPVPPLEIPDLERLPETEALERIPAVDFFIQRAQHHLSHFQPSDAEVSTIAEICVRLDGLPLAIRLAAARIGRVSLSDMLLEPRLGIAIGGPVDQPPRLQNLEKLFEWSYDLLDEGEKRLFRRLSVFAGGFTLRAAEAVCNAAGDSSGNVRFGLASLADKSLLEWPEWEPNDDLNPIDEPRLMLLQTLREYARERLEDAGEAEEARHAHAGYYLARAEEGEPKLNNAEQRVGLDQLEAEHDNLLAVLRRSLRQETQEGAGTALRLSGALWWFWLKRGFLGRGRHWLKEALKQREGVSASVQAKALAGAGILAHYQAEDEEAQKLCDESLDLCRQQDNKRGIAIALNGLGLVACAGARSPETLASALKMFEDALDIHKELGDEWGIVHTLNHLAYTHWRKGDYSAALSPIEENLAKLREAEYPAAMANALRYKALTIASQGEYDTALSLCDQALAMMREPKEKRDIAKVLLAIGDIASKTKKREYSTARTKYKKGLALFEEVGDQQNVACCLEGLAGVAVAQDQFKWAVLLCAAAEARRTSIKAPLPDSRVVDYRHCKSTAKDNLGEATYTVVWSKGLAMTPKEALAEEGKEPVPPPRLPADLSPCQFAMLCLICQGLTNEQIAYRRRRSESTIKNQVKSMLDHLKNRGEIDRSGARVAAVTWAQRNKLDCSPVDENPLMGITGERGSSRRRR